MNALRTVAPWAMVVAGLLIAGCFPEPKSFLSADPDNAGPTDSTDEGPPTEDNPPDGTQTPDTPPPSDGGSPPAGTCETVFEEDFDNLKKWTIEPGAQNSLTVGECDWHVHAATGLLHYGKTNMGDDHNYKCVNGNGTPKQHWSTVTSESLTLGSSQDFHYLMFRVRLDVVHSGGIEDILNVSVVNTDTNETVTHENLTALNMTGWTPAGYHDFKMDISTFKGAIVKIQLNFDTVNGYSNEKSGVWIRELSVQSCDQCAPICLAKTCVIDGCGKDCFTCDDGEVCNNAQNCCLPQCDKKVCGNDGCDGNCGKCTGGTLCTGDGQCNCVASCTDANGVVKACGDDGCGGNCGKCLDGTVGTDAGQCEDAGCTPECTGKACGDDGCGGNCGTCPEGNACNIDGQCVCQAQCTGKSCGDDGCGATCATCAEGTACNTDGQCETVCTPACSGKKCGDDGCGGDCGQCGAGLKCSGSKCSPCFHTCTHVVNNILVETVTDCGGFCFAKASDEWKLNCEENKSKAECVAGTALTCLSNISGHYLTMTDCAAQGLACAVSTYAGNPYALCVGAICGDDADCDDSNVCTEDSCTENNVCLNAVVVVNCCTSDEDCDENATCTNNGGGSECTCKNGFVGDGKTCTCLSDCDGKECGNDGCDGICGPCVLPKTCSPISSKCECVPNCDDKKCGDDGCGSTCGNCGNDKKCEDGKCND